MGLLARLDVITLPAPYDDLAATPVLVVLAVLLGIEFFADKIPGVDSANDIVQTVIRPAAGGLLAAGSVGVLTDIPPWVGLLAGIVAAGGVHATKAVVRPAVNVSTAGVGAPVVSAGGGRGLGGHLAARRARSRWCWPWCAVVAGLVLWRWWRGRRSRRAAQGAAGSSTRTVVPDEPDSSDT